MITELSHYNMLLLSFLGCYFPLQLEVHVIIYKALHDLSSEYLWEQVFQEESLYLRVVNRVCLLGIPCRGTSKEREHEG